MTDPAAQDGGSEAAESAPDTARDTAADDPPAAPAATPPATLPAARGRRRGAAKKAAKAERAPKKPSAARKWLSRNNTRISVAAAVGSFVVASAFAGAAVQPYLVDRATVATKMKIAETAADAISSLWTYTPDDMDRLSERSAKYLGGDFEQQYRKYVDAIAATNKQAKVSSKTQVVGAAVESLRGGAGGAGATEATAIVYTNTTSSTPQTNNIPAIKYLSYRLELKRYGRDWRVTKMTTVTSLDLTPKLGP